MRFHNFYQRCIEGFSRMAKPLCNRTKKDVKFDWGEKEQAAFEELRLKPCSTRVLTYFKPGWPLLIETDLPKYLCSGILSQQEENSKGKLGYWSKVTEPVECHYGPHDKELLAIVQVLKECRRYSREAENISRFSQTTRT